MDDPARVDEDLLQMGGGGGGGGELNHCEEDEDNFDDFMGVPTDVATTTAAAAVARPNDPVAFELDFESGLVEVFNHKDNNNTSKGSSMQDEHERERDNNLVAGDCQGVQQQEEQVMVHNPTSGGAPEQPLVTAPDNVPNREQKDDDDDDDDDDDGFGVFGGFDGTSNPLNETVSNKEHSINAEEQGEFGVFRNDEAQATAATMTENVNARNNDDDDNNNNNNKGDDFGVFGTSIVDSSSKEEHACVAEDGFEAVKDKDTIAAEASEEKEGNLIDPTRDACGAAESLVQSASETNEASNDGDPLGELRDAATTTTESFNTEKNANKDGDGVGVFDVGRAAAATTLTQPASNKAGSNVSDDRDDFGTLISAAAGTTPLAGPTNENQYLTADQNVLVGFEATVAASGSAEKTDQEDEPGNSDRVEGSETLGDDLNDNTQPDSNQKQEKVDSDGGAHGSANAGNLRREIQKESNVDRVSTKESHDSRGTFENSHLLAVEKNTESSSMADINTPEPGVVIDKMNEVDQFGAFDSALDENPINDQQTENDADFGDFGDFDSAPMDSATEKAVNGFADSNNEDDDFGEFGGADETVTENIGYEGVATSIPAQHPAPQQDPTESGDPFLSHARSTFQHLFAKYSQPDPTDEQDTREDSPERPPPTIAEILLSLKDKVENNKRESRISESVLKVLHGTRTATENISPRCIISNTAKGPYSHFNFSISLFDTISAESQGQTAFVSDELQFPIDGESSAADELSSETKTTPTVLTETVVALPPLSATATKPAIADAAKTSATLGNSQKEPGQVDRLLSQVSDLSFMLSPRLSLPEESDTQ